MKKVCSICLTILMISLISGCATRFPEEDTVYIQKNGTISEASVESFDKDYYSQEELESFIKDEIDDYEKDYDGSVKMVAFKVEEDTAKLMMKYGDYQSYSDFNGQELFTGTVVQAIAAGYQFDVNFAEVKDGEVEGESLNTQDATESLTEAVPQTTSAVDAKDITSNEDYKVVILNEDTDVEVKGTIRYVSTNGVTLKDENTASVKALNGEVSYLVYE